MSDRLTKEEWEAVGSLVDRSWMCNDNCRCPACVARDGAVKVVRDMLERRKPLPDLATLADAFFANPCLETRKSLWLAIRGGDVGWEFPIGFVRPRVGAICALPDSFQNLSYPIRIS